LNEYLDSYHVLSLKEQEQQLVKTRVRTLIQLLDRVLEAGDNDRIQRAILRMNFILEQELSEELIMMYQQSLSKLVMF
jgi:ribosomal protein S20